MREGGRRRRRLVRDYYLISVLLVNTLSYWMMNRFIARKTK